MLQRFHSTPPLPHSLPLPGHWRLNPLPVQLRQLGWRPGDAAEDKPSSACRLLWGGCQPCLLTVSGVWHCLRTPTQPLQTQPAKPGCWNHPLAPEGLRPLSHPALTRITASYTLRGLRTVKEIDGFFGFNVQSRCLWMKEVCFCVLILCLPVSSVDTGGQQPLIPYFLRI